MPVPAPGVAGKIGFDVGQIKGSLEDTGAGNAGDMGMQFNTSEIVGV